jgi:hypothetical protein
MECCRGGSDLPEELRVLGSGYAGPNLVATLQHEASEPGFPGSMREGLVDSAKSSQSRPAPNQDAERPGALAGHALFAAGNGTGAMGEPLRQGKTHAPFGTSAAGRENSLEHQETAE